MTIRLLSQCKTPDERAEFLANLAAKSRAVTRAELHIQVARAKGAAAPEKPSKKPKPKKKAKTMPAKSVAALVRALGGSTKRKPKRSKAFAESLRPDPKLLAFAADSWGIEGFSDEHRSAVAGAEEAESIARVCFEMGGVRTVPELVRARDAARAKAMGLQP